MKKIKKTKTGLTVTLGFAAVALLSVGFSAWVVNLDSSKDTGNVSVEVADTTTNTVTITTEMIDSKFRFDALPSQQDNGGPITSDSGAEDLSFAFWVKVEKTGTGSNGAITYNFQTQAAEGYTPSFAKLAEMVELNYIEAPFDFNDTPIELIGSDLLKSSTDYDTYYDPEEKQFPKVNVDWDANSRYKVTMHFRWGSHTGYENPCLHDQTDDEVSASRDVLDYLNDKDNKDLLTTELVRLTISHTY